MGQVGLKLAQVEPKLESSWHLEAILPTSCHLGPSWPHLGGILEAIWPNLGRQRRFLGSKVRRRGVNPGVKGAGPTECARPVEDEVFEEEESAESEGGLARPCHPVCDRGRRIQSLTRIPPGFFWPDRVQYIVSRILGLRWSLFVLLSGFWSFLFI